MPSLRFPVHLSSPELDIIGAGEPFLPGVSLGHNGVIAVGITRFYIDQEDLHVYETNRSNQDEYRCGPCEGVVMSNSGQSTNLAYQTVKDALRGLEEKKSSERTAT